MHSLLYISAFFLLFLEVSLVLHFILWLEPLWTCNLFSLVCCKTSWLNYNLFKWHLCTSKNYFQLNTFVSFITIHMLSNFQDSEMVWDSNLYQSSTSSSSSLLILNFCFACFSTKKPPQLYNHYTAKTVHGMAVQILDNHTTVRQQQGSLGIKWYNDHAWWACEDQEGTELGLFQETTQALSWRTWRRTGVLQPSSNRAIHQSAQ